MRKKKRNLNIFDVCFDNSIFSSSLDENYAQRKRINKTIKIKIKRKKVKK